jgi:diguanylate cyclase (GGDEF)-like protein
MIDVDDFKKYNDNYGHQAGDLVLQKISLAMQDLIRPFDLLARYGGEEFTILLPDTSLQEAITVFERIRSGIADMPTIRDGALTYQTVTVSIGVAQHIGDELPEMLLARADRALYMAKRNGKNRVVVESPEDS